MKEDRLIAFTFLAIALCILLVTITDLVRVME
jgi:hypothetical protein